MTYLELCQRLRQEVGASGDDSTVASATGEWLRLCTYIKQAYIEIQELEQNWNWMRVETSFDTVANQAEYAYASSPLSLSDFARWRDYSFRIYKDDIGDEHILEFWDYNIFRDTYLLSTSKTTYSYPHAIAVSPIDSLFLALPPDGVYKVTGEYYKTPTELSSDSDTPSLPSRYHMSIVYRAMQDYAFYENAEEVLRRGTARYSEMIERLRFDETEDVSFDRNFL